MTNLLEMREGTLDTKNDKIVRTRPDTELLLQSARLLVTSQGFPHDEEDRKEKASRLKHAINLSTQALEALVPDFGRKSSWPEIASVDEDLLWFAVSPKDIDNFGFHSKYSTSLAELDSVPEGHFIVGVTRDGTEIVRGQVASGQAIDWTYGLVAQRRESANDFLKSFLAGEVYSFIEAAEHALHGSDMKNSTSIDQVTDWLHDEYLNCMTCTIYTESEENNLDDYCIRVDFERDSNKIVEMYFDNEKITPCKDDVPEPDRNDSPEP